MKSITSPVTRFEAKVIVEPDTVDINTQQPVNRPVKANNPVQAPVQYNQAPQAPQMPTQPGNGPVGQFRELQPNDRVQCTCGNTAVVRQGSNGLYAKCFVDDGKGCGNFVNIKDMKVKL